VAELADPSLRAALQAGQASGDLALEELERAISTADRSSRAAVAALDPRPPEGGPAPEGSAGGGEAHGEVKPPAQGES